MDALNNDWLKRIQKKNGICLSNKNLDARISNTKTPILNQRKVKNMSDSSEGQAQLKDTKKPINKFQVKAKSEEATLLPEQENKDPNPFIAIKMLNEGLRNNMRSCAALQREAKKNAKSGA